MSGQPKADADIVGYTVREAERLEDTDSWDDIEPLEVNYTVNQRGTVTGVELVLTVGGPDIRADALTGVVTGSWGGETHRTHFDSDVVAEYGQMLADQFEERIQ
jgi:hypothetical protein